MSMLIIPHAEVEVPEQKLKFINLKIGGTAFFTIVTVWRNK